jgi:vacuolar-type H+-ATPase subunit I/STV1
MNETSESYYERRLMKEIEELEKRIKDLTQEQLALKRQLVKVRRNDGSLKDVSRKNSANRVMTESRVLKALRINSRECSTAFLYKEGLLANFDLKENTFRTYLHRMKEKGLIRSVRHGFWRLTEAETPPP